MLHQSFRQQRVAHDKWAEEDKQERRRLAETDANRHLAWFKKVSGKDVGFSDLTNATFVAELVNCQVWITSPRINPLGPSPKFLKWARETQEFGGIALIFEGVWSQFNWDPSSRSSWGKLNHDRCSFVESSILHGYPQGNFHSSSWPTRILRWIIWPIWQHWCWQSSSIVFCRIHWWWRISPKTRWIGRYDFSSITFNQSSDGRW